ncbi:hypothetical protein Nepgr_027589 [Nepenthes gracilis]|uniref:Uncharacterized protein n=1 Tax=Nepenthes gracilis TaxID=150966 RepID=A0AAD3TBM9_NEPGR|nr:hypothetical protein Nepgr_027589 [Nepenthes gracilis]
MALENEGTCKRNEPLWKVLEAHHQHHHHHQQPLPKGRRSRTKERVVLVKAKRIKMKRRALVEGSRRRRGGVDEVIERRVLTLRKLVPNSQWKGGLEGLFGDAADYIVSLQMRVRAMQLMVDALSGPC